LTRSPTTGADTPDPDGDNGTGICCEVARTQFPNESRGATMTSPDPSAQVGGTPPIDKSVGAALVLTFFFGPLGLFYVTVTGAVIMTVVSIVVAILTIGFGLIIMWVISMVWSAVVASKQHQEFEAWKVNRLAGGAAAGVV
jgi:hypothetical protein